MQRVDVGQPLTSAETKKEPGLLNEGGRVVGRFFYTPKDTGKGHRQRDKMGATINIP
jgi:hypothetical protein